MALSFSWSNGFLLNVPILLWNLMFVSKLTHTGFKSDSGLPRWLLLLEHALRIPFFFLPLLLPLQLQGICFVLGRWLFGLGALLYLVSWLPLMYRPHTAWSQSLRGFLAPYLTPLIWGLGIALLCESWIYAIVVLTFVSVQTLLGGLRYCQANSSSEQ